jgi:mono/diheme cytochrome c family protein
MSTHPTHFALVALLATSSYAQNVMEDGKKLFLQTAVPACAICHTMKHAGSVGEVGPSLDELKPDTARVEKAIRNGLGQMPANKSLSDEQIKLLSKYVASATAK